MTPEPLKPCPLCGSEAKAFTLAKHGQVKCSGCNLKLECDGGSEAAVEKWNVRQSEKVKG